MKKVFAFLLCLALLLLAACGPADSQNDSATTAASTTEPVTLPPDDGIFDYQKTDLPKGWTVDEEHCTSTYLQATYGEQDNAPVLTVSVFAYNDSDGAAKSKSLAQAVQSRENTTVSDIFEVQFGGLPFYMIHFASKSTEGLLRYEAYGQTNPAKDGSYHFVIITLENVKDDKHFDALKGVLDCMEFKF